jgi:anti-sigma B factor antagonist
MGTSGLGQGRFRTVYTPTNRDAVPITSHSLKPLELAVFDAPPECLVAVAGELDMATAPELTGAMDELGGSRRLVTLDLRALTFMDVAGLRAVVEARRSVRRVGHRLQILQPAGEAARVLEMTGGLELLS